MDDAGAGVAPPAMAGGPPTAGAPTADGGTAAEGAGRDSGAPGAQVVRPLPQVLPPVRLGALVGPDAREKPNVAVYGTDLGLSYRHDGRLRMLFGDTWPYDDFICGDERPANDDTLASLPPSLTAELPPPLSFVPDDAGEQARAIEVMRGSTSLSMGFGQVPMTAFSDGEHLLAAFARLEPTRCGEAALADAGRCRTDDGFACSMRLGECLPATTAYALVCDAQTQFGCYPGQRCEAVEFCFDATSSQYDQSVGGEASSLAQETELALQRPDSPTIFDSVHVLSTSKFGNMTSRTVHRFTEHGSTAHGAGNDYRPGEGAVLIWGRPGFVAEHGRENQLYLMTLPLPLRFDAEGKLEFHPRYYAGIDETSGEPLWSDRESEAAPLPLDGRPGGNPREEVQVVNQMAISWLGPPIDKWVMLYGGDLSDFLAFDPSNVRTARAPGSILMRMADDPWGPWSPPRPHLSPGNAQTAGDPYGPGGFIFHPDCEDTEQRVCAQSDPARPPDASIPGCPVSLSELDPGRLYGVNIIDQYTHANAAGGIDLVWNVSTWNPYGVQLMKTSIMPVDAPPPELELSDARGLLRLGSWKALPELTWSGRYVQQSSRDSGTDDNSFPLSGNGNRDFNNFLCASADAKMSADQFAPFRFEQERCEEDYVRGVVLGRFEGPGWLVRMWIGMASLLYGPADDEILRIYVDDDPVPRIEVPLATALDGRAGEIFAPPFGAGSDRRMAWYYPVAFGEKLIVALDGLGPFDEYFYHCDALVEPELPPEPPPPIRLPERDLAAAQLGALYRPAGEMSQLGAVEQVTLAARESARVERTGPATVHELRLRVAADAMSRLSGVHLAVRWDGAEQPAIDLPLLDLFASSATPPDRPSAALTSFVEGTERVLWLKLPMPFASSAEWTFDNRGLFTAAFSVELLGESRVPAAPFGHLHTQRAETLGPTLRTHHVAAQATGRGRLVGVCALVEGRADPTGGLQYDPLNLLEGDIMATVDGMPALEGTGTEEYADDVFYFTDAPHARAFVQAWGRVSDPQQSARGRANLCRWHVLGTELDFSDSLELSFELGGAGNPMIVDRVRTVAFVYQD